MDPCPVPLRCWQSRHWQWPRRWVCCLFHNGSRRMHIARNTWSWSFSLVRIDTGAIKPILVGENCRNPPLLFSKDLRLARTTGHPFLMPFATPPAGCEFVMGDGQPDHLLVFLDPERHPAVGGRVGGLRRICPGDDETGRRRDFDDLADEFDGPLVIGADALPFRSGIFSQRRSRGPSNALLSPVS